MRYEESCGRMLLSIQTLILEIQGSGLFTTQDLLVIDNVFRDEPVSDCFRENLLRLVDSGVIEQISRGRGSRYVLSRQFYEFIGKRGIYTRKRGLDRETNKALLLKHISDNDKDGTRFKEFTQVLPSLSENQIKSLLRELKGEGQVYSTGKTRAGLWHIRKNGRILDNKSNTRQNTT